MDKRSNVVDYIDTVRNHTEFFKRYYFHSLIDSNLTKLDSILQYGILSKEMIEEQHLISLYTHNSFDFDSKNGSKYISLSEYTESCGFHPMFEAFSLHTLSSLSLMVDKEVPIELKGERETYFDDEIFCYRVIPVSSLKGIILPDSLSSLPISKVRCLPRDLSCYTKSYLNHWIECMKQYFDIYFTEEMISHIKISYEQLWEILKKYESPERWIVSAIQEQQNQYGQDLLNVLASILETLWSEYYHLSNPTFMDVVMNVNDEQLPIYEIQSKSLKCII